MRLGFFSAPPILPCQLCGLQQVASCVLQDDHDDRRVWDTLESGPLGPSCNVQNIYIFFCFVTFFFLLSACRLC